MIRTITEKARAMISGAKLNKIFWGEAILTATFLINSTPTEALKNDKTPYELWHDKKPELKFLALQFMYIIKFKTRNLTRNLGKVY